MLRYWEQEFTQLRPMKRRGNRRYYQRHEVLLIRRIRELLHDQGFTISGARNQLGELVVAGRVVVMADGIDSDGVLPEGGPQQDGGFGESVALEPVLARSQGLELASSQLRAELLSIRALLAG